MAMNYDFRSIEASAYNDWIKDDVYRVTENTKFEWSRKAQVLCMFNATLPVG